MTASNDEPKALLQPPGWSTAFDRVADAATAKRVFGEPVVAAGRTVIPMASVFSIFGLGGGDAPTEAASGGGGGGILRVTPVGVVELDSDGVHVYASPIVSARIVTTIALVVAWNVFWIAYTIRKIKAGQADTRNRA